MADFTKEELAEAIVKANAKLSTKSSTTPTAPGAGNKAIDAALSETANKLNPFAQNLKDGGEAAKKGFETAQKAVTDSLDTWRDLSKSGAGFNNDVVGMTVAAAGTRLPLKEFAGVIKDNTDVLGALGGSVTRGAESFAKMSKSFFDSGATDSLKLLGYTNKDLNEVLMLQAVTMRGKFKDDQQRDAVAIENASKLATEMDLMAKLTGKSREAQMEQMKKNQMDMQFEASIRLKTQGMNAEDAAKFEANARMQLKDAQLRGQGDMFKEVFATGQIVSKESAMQAAVNQEQANATMKQARATAAGDEKAAAEANREAQRAAVADANNTTKLGMVALGGAAGVAGKALTDSMGAQMTYTRSLEATAAANGYDLKTKEGLIQAQKAMEEEAKKAQSGKNKEGEQVDGATKAAVQLGNRVDDVRAALTTGLLEPLNKEIGPGLRTFADKYLSGKDFEGSGKRMAPAIEGAMARGNKAAQADGAPDYRTEPDEAGLATGLAKSVGFGAGKVSKVAKEILPKPIPEKAKGGPVEEGEPYIVGDGGEEEIFVPKTAGEIIPKSMLAPKGLGSRSNNLQTASGGLNLNEISKDISTTVSGGGSSTVKGPDMREMSTSMGKMGLGDSQKKIFDEMMSLSSQQSKEKLQSLLEEKASAQAANMEAAKARDVIEERLEAEGKSIKDLAGADKERFDALTKQMNDSYDASDKVQSAIKAAERAESTRLNLQKMGYEVGIKQEEDKVKSVESTAEKIKSDILDAIPIKDIADKVDSTKTILSDHQQTVLKYAYEDAEGKQMQLDNQKNRIKGELNSIAEKNKSIEDIQKEADGRELTQREQNRIDRLQKEIESNKESLKIREEELFVYENLDKLKTESAEKTASILEEKTEKINNDIKSAMPVDTEFGDLDGAIAKNKEDDERRAFYNSSAYTDQATANPDQSAMKEVVAGSSPTAAQGRGITADSFTLGPNGMPIAKPKSTAAAVPDKPAEKQASPGKKINPETGEEYTPVGDAKPSDKKSAAAGGSDSKAATLDDVVKSLNALNTKMGQLISTTESGSRDVAKAAKSGSNNVYAR